MELLPDPLGPMMTFNEGPGWNSTYRNCMKSVNFNETTLPWLKAVSSFIVLELGFSTFPFPLRRREVSFLTILARSFGPSAYWQLSSAEWQCWPKIVVLTYSRVSNNRDHHDTFTSPKVTHITLLLANITHTRARKFFANFLVIIILMLVKVSEKSSKMHCMMLLIQGSKSSPVWSKWFYILYPWSL